MEKDILEYEKMLTEERGAVLRELKEAGAATQSDNQAQWEPKVGDVDSIRSDASDIAERLETYGENAALVRRLKKRIAEIDAALEKIKNNENSFGVCRVCGKKIETERLRANPAAETCKTHINQ